MPGREMGKRAKKNGHASERTGNSGSQWGWGEVREEGTRCVCVVDLHSSPVAPSYPPLYL